MLFSFGQNYSSLNFQVELFYAEKYVNLVHEAEFNSVDQVCEEMMQ